MMQSLLFFPAKPQCSKVLTIGCAPDNKLSRREFAMPVRDGVFGGMSYTTRCNSGDIVRRDFVTGDAPYVVVGAGDTPDSPEAQLVRELVPALADESRLVRDLLSALVSIQTALDAPDRGPYANTPYAAVETLARIRTRVDAAVAAAKAAQ